MSVLREILSWSKSCPKWQRDALRRLVRNGALAPNDLAELTLICKSAHSLTAPGTPVPPSQPLAEEHLPPNAQSDQSVTLTAIEEVQNVNALACKQPLTFGPSGLTIVYGDNASGKSGYARILKCACRARSRPKQVLPDIFSSGATSAASATIRFKVGDQDRFHQWRDGETTCALVSLVSVFDSACALQYVEEANDVAFRPFGLDLLDKLASACTHLKRGFDQERATLAVAARDFSDLSGPTDVGKLVGSLSAQTAVEVVERLANLSSQESQRLENLKKQVAQIEAEDPAIRAKEFKGRASRLDALGKRLAEIQSALSAEKGQALKEALSLANSTAEAAKLTSASAFKDEPMKGVGSETWKQLWEAARRYSEAEAYPGTAFPVVSDSTRCVLCQQPLGQDAVQRLSRFESFVKAETQKAAQTARKRFNELQESFQEQAKDLTAPDELLAQLELTHATCAAKIRSFLESAATRRAEVSARLTTNNWPNIPALNECPVDDIAAIVADLNTIAAEFERAKAPEKLAELKAERDQLLARQRLGLRKAEVLSEIARLKRLNALAACLRDVDTTATSRKSTELTKSCVTKAICDTFKRELTRLGLAYLRVELVPTGSERGVMYHRVELRAKRSADIQEVVSEGEHRCIALAAFLAELATATHKSSLVFDDPVSSLDHSWRESVACRLVEEVQERQVIVFTHDLVFLLLLLEHAEKESLPLSQAHLTRNPQGSGICSEGPPWLAMPVKTRIGTLKAQWQQAEKLCRTEGPVVYEALARDLYGRLRETWERAVEEVLLNGAVVRFRRSIETQRLDKLTDVAATDIQTIEAAMTKCSTHLRGHDQAAAINQPVPQPTELKADIEQLENWVTQVRKRRG